MSAVASLCEEVCAHLRPWRPWDLEQMGPLLEAQLIMLRSHPIAQHHAERHLLCLLVAAVLELGRQVNSTDRPTTENTCERTCGAGGPSSGRRRPMSGAERARRYREKKARGG